MRVAIIGGGIGGLTAALACRAGGAAVTIHEQADEIGDAGAGIQVSPNAAWVLDRLGLLPDLAEIATRPEAVILNDALTGAALARVPMGDAAQARYGHGSYVIHRADLAMLLAKAADRAGVALNLGAELTDAADLDADVVIAADGIKSRQRAALFGGGDPVFSDHVAWRALVPLSGAVPAITRNWLAPGRHVVTYPLRQSTAPVMNIVAVEETRDPADANWRQPGDLATFQKRFGGFCPALADLLARVETVHKWGLFHHPPLGQWVTDRVALLGDAAHPMVPFLAQGAAMAIEDAWILALCLDQGEDVAAALAVYQARRMGRAGAVQAASLRAGGLYHAGGAKRLMRNGGMRMIGAFWPGLFARRMDWIYDPSQVLQR